MRKRKLFYALTLCLLILVLGSIPVYAEKPVMTYQELTMYAGNTAAFKIDGNRKKATWTSSKKSVATVSKEGIVKAKKPGKCIIKAVLKKKTFLFRLTVEKKKPGNLPAVVDTNGLPVKLVVNYNYQGNVCGYLIGFNAEGNRISTLRILYKKWFLSTEYNHEDDTYSVTVSFKGQKAGGPRLTPCYFAWECYNRTNDLVQGGVYISERQGLGYRITRPLSISGLEEDSYRIVISDYHERKSSLREFLIKR